MKKIFWLLIGLLSCISFWYCYTSVYAWDWFQPTTDYVCVYWNYKFNFFHLTDVNYNSLFSCDNNCGITDSVCYKVLSWSTYAFQFDGSTIDIDFLSIWWSCPDCPIPEPCDCSSYQNAYNQCSLDLNSCRSDITECWRQFNICSGSLSSCQHDLNGASGYVSTLEWELNQCTQDLINCSNSTNTWSCETWNNWSALYINDIQHLWKPNIFITIPEEIDWDYTSEWDDFDLDIVGYNVDTEYIDWIIRTQNYKPTTEDFTKLVWLLAPYTKILVFLLFVFLIWAWIKKPFKSKKL